MYITARSIQLLSALCLTPCVPDMWHDARGPSLSHPSGWRRQRSAAGTRRQSTNPEIKQHDTVNELLLFIFGRKGYSKMDIVNFPAAVHLHLIME